MDDMAPASTPSSAAGAVVLRGTGRGRAAQKASLPREYFHLRRFGVTGGGAAPPRPCGRWPLGASRDRAPGPSSAGGRARATPGRRRREPRASPPRPRPGEGGPLDVGDARDVPRVGRDRGARSRDGVDVRGAAQVRGHPGRRESGNPRPRVRHARGPRTPPATHGGARRDARQAPAQLVRVGSGRRGGVAPAAVRVCAQLGPRRVRCEDAHRAHGHRGASLGARSGRAGRHPAQLPRLPGAIALPLSGRMWAQVIGEQRRTVRLGRRQLRRRFAVRQGPSVYPRGPRARRRVDAGHVQGSRGCARAARRDPPSTSTCQP